MPEPPAQALRAPWEAISLTVKVGPPNDRMRPTSTRIASVKYPGIKQAAMPKVPVPRPMMIRPHDL